MIGRTWYGWTSKEKADRYETLLRGEILPEIVRAEGCRGAYALRREHDGRVEFVTFLLFDSLEAVRAFAGDEYETAVVPAQARALLADFQRTASHYEVVLSADSLAAG